MLCTGTDNRYLKESVHMDLTIVESNSANKTSNDNRSLGQFSVNLTERLT